MITPVSSSQNTVKTSIFYINDYHGKSINMERTATAVNEFDNSRKNGVDKLKFSSGDIMLGEVVDTNKVAVKAQNMMGIMASAVGNHEYDITEHANEIVPDMRYRLLACNVKMRPDNPYNKKIEKSYIQEINGNKYGIIGTSPSDLISRVKHSKIFAQYNVDDISKTIQDIQVEVDKLRKQGINKIILLSHSGFGYDRKIAEETEGIDVILGGHSHNLIKGIEQDYNLLKTKSGEYTVITQAGRDGKNFGILDLEFDKQGRIVKVRNSVAQTRKFKRNGPYRYIFEQILGKPVIIGKIANASPPLTNDLIEPNPHAQFVADCIKEDLDCDIALLAAANVRGYFESGNLDTSVLDEISPFRNKLCIIPYTEKELVDAIKMSCQSMIKSNNKPGLIHPSGLRYTVSKEGELKEMSFVDKSGLQHPINIYNPDLNKIYRVGINDYYAQGNDGFAMLNKYDKAEKYCDFDLIKCVEDHFKRDQTPVTIKDDGRIKIID